MKGFKADLAVAGMEAMPDGVVVVDAQGVVEAVNPVLAGVCGAGRRLADCVVGTGDDDVARVIAAGAAGGWHGVLRARDDEAAAWDVALAPLPRGGVLGLFRDARDRLRAESARLELLSTVTHDIRAPLTVIMGYADLLSDPSQSPSPAMLTDTLARIRESGEQILALVSNFSEMNRHEAGAGLRERQPVDLCDVATRLVEQQNRRAVRKGVTLALEESPVPSVEGSRPQLERVVLNLLGNAIKYTPRGGRVVVRTHPDASQAALSVEDTGPGIPDEDLGNIFEKFRCPAMGARADGVGLGLFVARAIARAHGGDVQVLTAPGRGSTFTLRVPTTAA